jgi:predicted ATPase
MAAGHGGQVLLSGAAAALVVGELPNGSSLLDLGEHRLKDLGRPERVFQLVHPGLPAGFPPLVTMRDRLRDLPVEPSLFVGREAELARIRDWLRDDSVRLVTLLGPGGIGKTRLALRAAAELGDLSDDGVSFAALDAARDTASVQVAIARSVGLADVGEESQLDEIVARMKDWRRLLILDNFEHVMAATSTVARLLHDCPGLKFLVTSREALNIRGEHLFQVPPLTLPDTAAGLAPAEQLMRYEAILLFVERAQAVRPGFQLTDGNAPAVVEICRRLDGLPLAIELATARLSLFSPDALRDRLGSRLGLLRSGARDLPERQQTLRATIEWSYQLLEPGEQRLFELLSAFAGTRVDAVEMVVDSLNGRLTGVDPLDGLASLVDKSLLRHADHVDGEPRFSMLETIREYATERLAELPDFGACVRRAHAVYFADFIRRQEVKLTGAGRDSALLAMADEAENLRLCWRYWVAERDVERLNGLVDGLWVLYDSRGWYRSTIELTSDLLDVLAATPPTPERTAAEITLRMSQARALMAMYGYTATVEAEYASALALIGGDDQRPQLLPVLRGLASYYNYRAEFEQGAQIGREILALAERQDDPSARVDGNLVLGASLGFLGDLHSGIRQLDAALPWFDAYPRRSSPFRLGNDPRVACLTTSAFYLWLLGYPDRSLERAERAVALASTLEHPSTRAYALFHVGFLHHWRQEWEPVRAHALEVLEVADDDELSIWKAVGTCLLGAASTALGGAELGLAEIARGIDLYQGMKSPPVFWPLLLALRAGACLQAGMTDDGLAFTDEAIGIVGEESRTPFLPELFLVKGDLLAAADGSSDDRPEPWYLRALDTARDSDARMCRLRAAIRLCRLPGSSDAPERRRLLESAHATFTEGFGTADLVAARALIEAGPEPGHPPAGHVRPA